MARAGETSAATVVSAVREAIGQARSLGLTMSILWTRKPCSRLSRQAKFTRGRRSFLRQDCLIDSILLA